MRLNFYDYQLGLFFLGHLVKLITDGQPCCGRIQLKLWSAATGPSYECEYCIRCLLKEWDEGTPHSHKSPPIRDRWSDLPSRLVLPPPPPHPFNAHTQTFNTPEDWLRPYRVSNTYPRGNKSCLCLKTVWTALSLGVLPSTKSSRSAAELAQVCHCGKNISAF